MQIQTGKKFWSMSARAALLVAAISLAGLGIYLCIREPNNPLDKDLDEVAAIVQDLKENGSPEIRQLPTSVIETTTEAFVVGHMTGVISDPQFARLGGIGNATQCSLLGQFKTLSREFGADEAIKKMADHGELAVQDQLKERLSYRIGPAGKITAEQATPYLLEMGMTIDEVRCFFSEIAVDTNEVSLNFEIKLIDRKFNKKKEDLQRQHSWKRLLFWNS